MHGGLIVDGARRWARANQVSLARGYERAFASVEELSLGLFANGVTDVSFYSLSRDNLKRSESDLKAVFGASTSFVVGSSHGFRGFKSQRLRRGSCPKAFVFAQMSGATDESHRSPTTGQDRIASSSPNDCPIAFKTLGFLGAPT